MRLVEFRRVKTACNLTFFIDVEKIVSVSETRETAEFGIHTYLHSGNGEYGYDVGHTREQVLQMLEAVGVEVHRLKPDSHFTKGST